jgi:hypothetical protein
MSDVTSFETFTPAERAFFDSKGEKPPVEEAPIAEEPEAETEEIEADAPEAEEETKAEGEKTEETEPPKRKDQRVPLRKLQEEVNARRELEKRLAQRDEEFARADERLKVLMQRFEQPEPQKETAPPDTKEDPLGAIEWTQKQLEAMQRQQAEQQRVYQQQAEISAIDTAYKQSWGQFASKTADALDGYQHFVNVTAQFLEMQGVPQEQINALVENEERKITVAALKSGRDPAEMIYESAKRMGYQPKAAQETDDSVSKKAEADIERRQKAQAASKSLSSTGGARGGVELTIEELARMPEDEFDAYMSKLSPAKRRKIMGE